MSQSLATFIKDPGATLDFYIEWASWLSTGDAVSDADWTADTGITIGSGEYAPSVSGTKATVWLSGGTAGTKYRVTCRLTTTAGRIDDRSITINVVDR